MMRCWPLVAAPPACSTRKLIGLASYIRRSLPGLPGSRLSQGYMKTPPRVRMRCTSRSEEHTSELQSRPHIVCRLLLDKKNGRLAVDEEMMNEISRIRDAGSPNESVV